MAASVRSWDAENGAENVTSVTLTDPDSGTSGDQGLYWVFRQGVGTGGSGDAPSTPSGLTKRFDNIGTHGTRYAYSKHMEGYDLYDCDASDQSETFTATVAVDRAGVLARIAGVDSSTVQYHQTAAGNVANNGTLSAWKTPSGTTDSIDYVDGAITVVVVAFYDGNTDDQDVTITDFTLDATTADMEVSDGTTLRLFHRVWSGSGTANPVIVNGTGGTSAPVALAWTFESTGGDATATISAAVTVAASVPAATATGDGTTSTTTVVLTAAVPEVTASDSSTAKPSTVTVTAAVPTATAAIDGEILEVGDDEIGDEWAGVTTPASVTVTAAVPSAGAVGEQVAVPGVAGVSVTVPSATASGSASGSAAPDSVAVTATVNDATASGSAPGAATPDVVTATVTVPAATATGSSAVTTTTTTAAVTVHDATATATGEGTATPTAVTITATIPAATGIGSGSATATPDAVAVAATIPAATAVGSTSGTATPGTLAVTAAVPAPSVIGGGEGTASPAVVAISTIVYSAIASGQAAAVAEPDAVAVGVTVYDAGPPPTRVVARGRRRPDFTRAAQRESAE